MKTFWHLLRFFGLLAVIVGLLSAMAVFPVETGIVLTVLILGMFVVMIVSLVWTLTK